MAAGAVKRAMGVILSCSLLCLLVGCDGAPSSRQDEAQKADISAPILAVDSATDPASANVVEAEPAKLPQSWLDKASLSFSPVMFGTVRGDIMPRLEKVVDEGCEQFQECSYADANGVEHFFWDQDELVLKLIDAKKFEGRSIPAFGIGRARSKVDVLQIVQKFFDGTRPECFVHEEYGSKTACQVVMGEGWTKLFFDRNDRLVYIRLDAYHYV